MSGSTFQMTPEQQAVVADQKHHLVVDAGAGSGKTTVIIRKLLNELGVEGASANVTLDEIVAITFTRKAAGELRERLRSAFFERAAGAHGRADREAWCQMALSVERARIGTLDSFAGRVIRDFAGTAGISSQFTVLEPGEASALMSDAARESLVNRAEAGDPGAGFLLRHFGFDASVRFVVDALAFPENLTKLLRGAVSTASRKPANETDLLLASHGKHVLTFVGTALDRYQMALERRGALDHAHVVLRAIEVAGHPEVQRAFQKKTRLLIVDEYQDTSLAQANLIFRLVGLPDVDALPASAPETDSPSPDPSTRLVLVGDPKQGIYSFRGADIGVWKRSLDTLDAVGGREFILSNNYRSRPEILEFVDHVLGQVMAPPKAAPDFEVPYRPLTATRPKHRPPGVELLLAQAASVKNRDTRALEARAVAQRIAEILACPEDHPVYELIDGKDVARPVEARDICILSRKLKGVSEHYERELRQQGVGCYIYGGRGLFDRPEIQDLVSLLQAVANPDDDTALVAALRSPLLGVDDVTIMELVGATDRSQGDGTGVPSLSLFRALLDAERCVRSEDGRLRARRAADLLTRFRGLRDRVSHEDLLRFIIEETDYFALLAGAPDAPTGIRNVEKFLRITGESSGAEPLARFVDGLEARVGRADPEGEAPLYTPEDDLVTITTIHKAKGLEWPFVFVVGADSGMFHRVRDEAPGLDREEGLTMPLRVASRGSAGEETAFPLSWTRFQERRHRELYAEAKRLFYVATTRARDRLVLSGALRYDSRPKAMEGSVGGLPMVGPEWWLRRIFPDLARKPDDGPPVPTVKVGSGLGKVGVRWFGQNKGELSEDHATEDGSHQWPRVIRPTRVKENLPNTHPVPPAVHARSSSVHHLAVLRKEFSASELTQQVACEWRHFYGYKAGISRAEVRGLDASAASLLSHEDRGRVIHEYLAIHDDSWATAERMARLRAVIQRITRLPAPELEGAFPVLLRHINAFLESEWYPRVRSALEVRREVPFMVKLAPDTFGTGTIDLMFREADGWRVIDFKTSLLAERSSEAVSRWLEAQKARHEPQAHLYSLSVERAGLPLAGFVLYFTDLARSVEYELSPEWLASGHRELLEAVEAIRESAPTEAPLHSKEKGCPTCPFLRVCRPVTADGEGHRAVSVDRCSEAA